MKPCRVLLVDRDGLVRESIAAVLRAQRGLEVAGYAATGQEAVARAERLQPDVVLTEIDLPVLNGCEVARQLHRRVPVARVAALTRYEGGSHLSAALQAGMYAYLTKRCTVAELTLGVDAAARGRRYVEPRLMGLPLALADARPPLTERERQVLQLLAEGYDTRQAAGALGVAAKTVGAHRGQLMRKLGIHGLAQLVRYAVATGITSADCQPRRIPALRRVVARPLHAALPLHIP